MRNLTREALAVCQPLGIGCEYVWTGDGFRWRFTQGEQVLKVIKCPKALRNWLTQVNNLTKVSEQSTSQESLNYDNT